MDKKTVEEAARQAIHKHYNCNGKYPCAERNYCEHFKGSNSAYDCRECGADDFKEGFFAGAEWKAKTSTWISVTDRLPEKGHGVFIVLSDGSGCIGYHDGTAWFVYGYGEVENVIAWIPIPSLDELSNQTKKNDRYMGEMCGDNRFDVIKKAKELLIKATNIESSPKEMEVIDNVLFRCWQMGWLEKVEKEEKK